MSRSKLKLDSPSISPNLLLVLNSIISVRYGAFDQTANIIVPSEPYYETYVAMDYCSLSIISYDLFSITGNRVVIKNIVLNTFECHHQLYFNIHITAPTHTLNRDQTLLVESRLILWPTHLYQRRQLSRRYNPPHSDLLPIENVVGA